MITLLRRSAVLAAAIVLLTASGCGNPLRDQLRAALAKNPPKEFKLDQSTIDCMADHIIADLTKAQAQKIAKNPDNAGDEIIRPVFECAKDHAGLRTFLSKAVAQGAAGDLTDPEAKCVGDGLVKGVSATTLTKLAKAGSDLSSLSSTERKKVFGIMIPCARGTFAKQISTELTSSGLSSAEADCVAKGIVQSPKAADFLSATNPASDPEFTGTVTQLIAGCGGTG